VKLPSRRLRMEPSCTLAILLCVAAGRTALAQAVTEWRTPAGLPVAVVEVAGGDVEHFTTLLPPAATLPSTLAGWPTSAAARPGALSWSLTVPTMVAEQAAIELAAAVAVTGCSALVAFGPVPARELQGPLAGLAAVSAPLALRPSCSLGDGRDEVVRGADERVELIFAALQPDDPQFDSLPALAAVLERRLAVAMPAVRVGLELRDGCWRLVARLAAGDESVRGALRRLREGVAASVTAPVTEVELSDATAPLRRSAVVLAATGGAISVELAERLAQGGRVAGALVPVVPGPAALRELLREVVGGRAGLAVVTEAERRGRPEEPETLPNGVIVSTRWLAEEIGVVALAFGSMDPAAGQPLAAALASHLAAGGWSAWPGEVAGVPVVTAVVPPADVPETLEAIVETIAEALAAAPEPPLEGLVHDVATAIGLRDQVAAESLSLALALPPDAEEGVEAARKFLSQMPAGGVRSTVTAADPHLVWTPDDAAPRLAAVLELPPTAAGWLAGEIVAARAGGDLLARAAWMSPAGRLALVLFAEGEAHVPELDARLASGWPRVRRPVAEAELTAAARLLFARLFGDLPAVTARAAARPFLPAIPTETALLAPDAGAVSAALAALPSWEALLRVARGPAPVVVPPPVRKSRASPG